MKNFTGVVLVLAALVLGALAATPLTGPSTANSGGDIASTGTYPCC